MESSRIGAYWGPRRESASECAERLAGCMTAIGRVDPALQAWFKRGASRAAANDPIDVGAAALTELLLAGVNRTDFGGEVIEELGFGVGAWNRTRPEVGMSAKLGLYSPNPGLMNSLVLVVPALDDGAGALYRPESAARVIESIVAAFDPDYATWTTNGWHAAQSPEPREPVVGWLTYLRGAEPLKLPVGTTEPLGEGILIRAAGEFSAVETDTIIGIRQFLQRKKALRRLS